jgi:hypothetical protein
VVPAPLKAISGPTSTSAMLSTTDMQDLVAFGEVLVAGRTLEFAERRDLVEYIQGVTGRNPQQLSSYRMTVSVLEHLAGRPFASLTIDERLELVSRHRLASSRVPSDKDPAESSAELRALRTRVVPDLIKGYYGSPAGWGTVGYHTFPGRCGDLTRYTRSDS